MWESIIVVWNELEAKNFMMVVMMMMMLLNPGKVSVGVQVKL